MLIEKDIWDLVLIGPCFICKNLRIWAKKVKKDQIVVDITQQIIREDVSNQITFNIIDIKDLKQIWDKLKSIYTEVGQRIVYLIL